jgi:hypothetical protein
LSNDGAGLEIARPSWAEVPALAAGKILVELTASALLALLMATAAGAEVTSRSGLCVSNAA